MIYGSVCSGIEAATVAWDPLGWTPAFFSDIEAFPRALLRHHYPDTPLHGRDQRKGEDFSSYADECGFQTIGENEYGPIDLLVGGTPCQSFSVAGKRGGMADGRGNLALEYIRLAHRSRARWVVWENVPGVFSSNGGEDFRCFLSGLVRWSVPIPEGGWANSGIIAAGPADGAYGLAWRVLDAQYFGVAQRRRRVFVVGHLGDWRRAAAVLLERESLSGHPAPRREKGEGFAPCLGAGAAASGQSPNVGNGQGTVVETAVPSHWDGDYPHPTLTQSAKGSGGPAGSRSETGNLTVVNPYDGDRVFPTLDRMMEAKFGSNQWVDSGQFVLEPFSMMPMNSGKDFKARETDVAQPIMAAGQLLGNQGGDVVVQKAIAIQERAICENPEAGPDGVGVRDDDTAYTLESRSVPQAVAFDLVQITSPDNRSTVDPDKAVPTLSQGSRMHVAQPHAVAFQPRIGRNGRGYSEDVVPALNGADAGATSDMRPCVATAFAVRRLTPRECERLQGFPDDYTLVPFRGKPASDGPRYKALGNSMAVPVMRWIGKRIQMVEDLGL